MNELDMIILNIKNELLNMAKQAHALGIGLQNVAPGDKLGTSNQTVEYLLSIADRLHEVAVNCEALMSTTFDHVQKKEL